MITAKVSDKYRVTLPSLVRKRLHVSIGDQLEVAVRGSWILLKPKKMIDNSQAYFWTKEWQEKEKAVDEDFAKGRFETAQDLQEFFHKLEQRKP